MSTITENERTPHRPWRGVDAADRVAERREKLIDAALTSFSTVGYANSTVQGICKEAGLTQRYFYESFPGKEQLLAAVVDRVAGDGFTDAKTALGDLDRPVADLARDGVTALIANLVDDPRRGHVLLVESVGVSADIEELRRHHFGRLRDLVRDVGIASLGEQAPPRIDADLTARALVGSTVELLVAYVRGELSVSTDRIAERLVQMMDATAPLRTEGTK